LFRGSLGIPLIYPNEGHGFFVETNKREYCAQLLAFFDAHTGKSAVSAD
jgi:dipeptidyl aminopeptidase/acylaminoacyl peptidase